MRASHGQQPGRHVHHCHRKTVQKTLRSFHQLRAALQHQAVPGVRVRRPVQPAGLSLSVGQRHNIRDRQESQQAPYGKTQIFRSARGPLLYVRRPVVVDESFDVSVAVFGPTERRRTKEPNICKRVRSKRN